MARTFALSFDRLNPDNLIDALAIHLLACAAHLEPGEPIPRNFLLALGLGNSNRDDVIDAINRICAIGLFDGNQMFTMHHLILQYVLKMTCVSLDSTVQQIIESYYYLRVFAPNAPISIDAIKAVFGIDDPRSIIRILIGRGLLHRTLYDNDGFSFYYTD